MVQNCLLLEIKCFLEENYKDLFVKYKENEFIGCKYHKNDKYYYFFISNHLNKITLTYRTNIDKEDTKRINIEELSIDEIKSQIILILSNIKTSKEFKTRKYLEKELKNIDNLENNFNDKEIKQKYEHIEISKLDMSFRLYNICQKNHINNVASFLLTPTSNFYYFDNLGKQTLKEVIRKKEEIINGQLLLNISLNKPLEKLDEIYYQPDKMQLKLEFTEDEYDNYIDFGIEIGTITIEVLKNILKENQLEVFKMRMGITDCDKNTLCFIGNYFNLSRERIRQILNNIMYRLQNNKYSLQEKYIKIFNHIKNKDILNYLLIGIEHIYNINFLEFILNILDEKISKDIIDRINTLYEKAKKDSNDQFVIYHVEEKLYNILNFPSNINEKSKEIFDLLCTERDTFDFNNNGKVLVSKLQKFVAYESELEKYIIKSYGKCTFVTDIKTQSLVIDYTYKNKVYQYYPDIQLLINDSILAIIEVKPLYNMVDATNLAKYDALKEYATKNGFGYVMMDDHFNSIEILQNVHVDRKIQDAFVELVRKNGHINYDHYRDFKTNYQLKMQQIEKIILDNREHIELHVKPFKISYID